MSTFLKIAEIPGMRPRSFALNAWPWVKGTTPLGKDWELRKPK
jgi:hypothetical protein